MWRMVIGILIFISLAVIIVFVVRAAVSAYGEDAEAEGDDLGTWRAFDVFSRYVIVMIGAAYIAYVYRRYT